MDGLDQESSSMQRLRLEMKKKNVKPSIVTYDTLVGGYCRMPRVERAIELVDEMKREGIRSNAIVCIDLRTC